MIAWAALAATAFDLICTVEQTAPPRDSGNFSMIFRVDLKNGQYCQGPCEEVRTIVATSTTELVLEDIHNGPEIWLEKVNLLSGAYTLIAKWGEADRFRSGKCTRADFSGFTPRSNRKPNGS